MMRVPQRTPSDGTVSWNNAKQKAKRDNVNCEWGGKWDIRNGKIVLFNTGTGCSELTENGLKHLITFPKGTRRRWHTHRARDMWWPSVEDISYKSKHAQLLITRHGTWVWHHVNPDTTNKEQLKNRTLQMIKDMETATKGSAWQWGNAMFVIRDYIKDVVNHGVKVKFFEDLPPEYEFVRVFKNNKNVNAYVSKLI